MYTQARHRGQIGDGKLSSAVVKFGTPWHASLALQRANRQQPPGWSGTLQVRFANPAKARR